MELSEQAKQIVRDFCSAINSAVENSTEVAEAIGRLREAGYEMELTLRLDIGLREHLPIGSDGDLHTEAAELELTEDDLRTLQRMKIRVDDE